MPDATWPHSCGQVRRLWRKRIELSTAEAEAQNEVDKLTQIIHRVDMEYQVSNMTGSCKLAKVLLCCVSDL